MNLNECNKNCIEFAQQLGFELDAIGLELKLERDDFIPSNHANVVELTPEYYADFCRLHDKMFPGTYYNGRDIIKRCNDRRKVFVFRPVTGYVYVEPNPDFAEANLEFIGVDPQSRGKGLGKALLSRAIEHVFSYENIDRIALAVLEDNPAKILYEKVGFKVVKKIHGYKKSL